VNRLSRREFVRWGAAGIVPAFAPPTRQGPRQRSQTAVALTAHEIVDRIKRAVGVEWKSTTVDTFKAGDPATVVTGIATTSLASIDVLRRVVKAGANMVVTCGPTFYSREDGATPSSPDPVFTAKNAFIERHHLVVWRFNDHWRLRTPDPFAQGLIDALGWARFRLSDDPRRVRVPALTLEALVADVKAALKARGGVRVIGRPQARVRTIGVLPGNVPIQAALTLFPQVDVIVAGEVREWEGAEYARDTVTSGLDKGLILVGRTLSEDTSMRVCAEWLKTIVSGLPCRWMPVGDPYWRP
jgi:putative NIF3 family GTP cyclohydrolase 1 type 2